MGLDVVELVMRIEEEFGIEIGDEDASQISTPGQMHAFLLHKLSIFDGKECATSRVFYRTRRALMEMSGAKRRAIRPATSLETLLPTENRRQHWKHFAEKLQAPLPALLFPTWFRLLVWLPVLAPIPLVFWSWGFAVCVYWVGLGVVFSVFAYKIGAPLAILFPASCQTVGEIARLILPSHLRSQAESERSASSQEVWLSLQAIIADEIGVAIEKVTPDADFIRDLNLD